MTNTDQIRDAELYSDDYKKTNNMDGSKIPNEIVVENIPTDFDHGSNARFVLTDPTKLTYSSSVGKYKLFMHPDKRNIQCWEIYRLGKSDRHIPIGTKVHDFNQDGGKLLQIKSSEWIFNAAIDGEIFTSEKEVVMSLKVDIAKGFTPVTPITPAPPTNSAVLPLQPRRLASRPMPAPWTSPAVDMETLMASIDDIKRSLNEFRMSARA